MSKEKKDDRLKAVPQDDQEKPEVYGVSRGEGGIKLGRRAFLGILTTASGPRNAVAQQPENQGFCGKLRAHKDDANTLAMRPGGDYLASGSKDTMIKLWSLKDDKLFQTFDGHEDSVNSIAFSSDGKYLVSGGWDLTVKIWSVPSGI